MKKTIGKKNKTSAIIDRLLNRHKNWKNYRRHTGLKLIRFS